MFCLKYFLKHHLTDVLVMNTLHLWPHVLYLMHIIYQSFSCIRYLRMLCSHTYIVLNHSSIILRASVAFITRQSKYWRYLAWGIHNLWQIILEWERQTSLLCSFADLLLRPIRPTKVKKSFYPTSNSGNILKIFLDFRKKLSLPEIL